MYAAPPRIDMEAFARLPDEFRHSEATSEWHQLQPAGFPGHSLLEGPSFDAQGNLWCVDIPWGRIFRVDPAGRFELMIQYDGEPNGLKIHRDGRIFVADFKNGIMVFDPVSRTIEPVLQRVNLERLRAVNDLVFSSDGDLYFTDQGLSGLHAPYGRVLCLRANGDVDVLVDNLPSPNGLVLNHDETALLVAVTRANAIWRVPLLARGRTAKVGCFIQMSGGGGPDGLALDEEGNLAIAHVGIGAVWLFSARGEPMYRLQSCAGHHTTNIAYGGDDRKTLFVTESESGTILKVRLPVAGRRMYSGF